MAMDTTTAEFCEAVAKEARAFAARVLRECSQSNLLEVDAWMKKEGGAFLRGVLGEALSTRAETLPNRDRCAHVKKGVRCDGVPVFRQRRTFVFHTVIPGREVTVWAPYTQCKRCRKGDVPLRAALGADKNGFTFSLRALGVKAATMEPFASASSELLAEFAGVEVSADKLQQMVGEVAPAAKTFADLGMPGVARPSQSKETTLYAQLDGSMLHIDRRWQETKVALLFEADARVALSDKRAVLLRKVVTAVRGDPQALEARLRSNLDLFCARDRLVVTVADGAEWIWNLAERLFPNRVEILDWYHLKEHVAATALALFGPDSPEAISWRETQLDRFWEHDDVDGVLSGLTFLRLRFTDPPKRQAIDDLTRYLTTHRHRLSYKSFRTRGFFVGSGAVESAHSHTLQQRMKRSGTRWLEKGGDALIDLRAIYRSTDAWSPFIRHALRPAA